MPRRRAGESRVCVVRMLQGTFADAGSQGLPCIPRHLCRLRISSTTAPCTSVPRAVQHGPLVVRSQYVAAAMRPIWHSTYAQYATYAGDASMTLMLCRGKPPLPRAQRRLYGLLLAGQSLAHIYVDMTVNTITISPRVLVAVATSRTPLPRLCHHHRRCRIAPYPCRRR